MIKPDRTTKKWIMIIYRGNPRKEIYRQEHLATKFEFDMFKQNVINGLPENHFVETKEI